MAGADRAVAEQYIEDIFKELNYFYISKNAIIISCRTSLTELQTHDIHEYTIRDILELVMELYKGDTK